MTVVTGFLSVVGGTILGFAAINTLGNAIAGFIVILSRPFMVGDRIYFQGKFSDVISIGIIYTKMRTLDLVYVSVPNQELLKSDIENYGKKRIVRRSVSITAGYEHDIEYVKKAHHEATQKVELILWAPKPIVAITEFRNYAVEYTLFFFIREVKRMMLIDSQIRDAIYNTCKENNIEPSTPLIISRDPIKK
ncbi:MAG: mechanosensitive ion channel family protein [Candidatus Thorarchaeota archaeon]